MSINQVINGKNRLVEHPNRYKLNAVSGQANTYDFEKQPGEIIDNGTPYSKLILDKIDNVLSYLIPSVVKVGTQNQFTLDNNGTFTNNQRVLVETPSTTDLDGVTSNTINGVPCDTLLQPSTKYELIYKYTSDKFELGDLSEKKPLFNITLTKAVSLVDLGDILSKIKTNTYYIVEIFNSTLATAGAVTFRNSNGTTLGQIGYLYASTNNVPSFGLFYMDSNNNISGWCKTGVNLINTATISASSYLDNFYIGTNSAMPIGTNIKIREL